MGAQRGGESKRGTGSFRQRGAQDEEDKRDAAVEGKTD